MTAKDIQVCINPHFDAVSLWIGSFGGADSPCDISRGVFAAKREVPRTLRPFQTLWDQNHLGRHRTLDGELSACRTNDHR